MIVGIDEVGRGAWAGPLVVGAVLLGGASIEGLTDSKKLSRSQREELDIEIRKVARGIGLGWVSARQVDQIGLSSALKLASRRALSHIRHDYKEIIIDGTIKLIEDPRVTLMKKADLLIPSVSAASIVAKVARDNYMRHVDRIFPGYKFPSHVGYGTAAHRNAIKAQGVTPLHRLSYLPLHNHKVPKKLASELHETPLTTKQIGDAAENEVANFLKRNGHTILERNWRTKFCEVDIISRRGHTLYFTEVKYRKAATYGDGFAAITPKKQRQMTFAAELYAASHATGDLLLAAASVSGTPPKLGNFLELV